MKKNRGSNMNTIDFVVLLYSIEMLMNKQEMDLRHILCTFCMKCPQILREKTSSQKYTVIALRIQWKLSAEGNAFRKCQQIILPLIIINAIIFRGQNLS